MDASYRSKLISRNVAVDVAGEPVRIVLEYEPGDLEKELPKRPDRAQFQRIKGSVTSLRPSVFNQRVTPDGGPFLHLHEHGEEAETVDVYFSDVDPEREESQSRLLLRVCPDAIIMWPINVGASSENYLEPKYGPLTEIFIPRPTSGSYRLPKTTEDVDELLERLPDGFETNWRLGLGLLYEFRSICRSIAGIGGITTLVVHGQSGEKDAIIRPPEYILGIKRFHALKRELTRTTNRFRREARNEKQDRIYEALLHSADRERFPPKTRKLKPDAISELTQGGATDAGISKRDRRTAVRLVRQSVNSLAKDEPHALLTLKSEIELVTLKGLIDRFSEMLTKELPESRWQAFLKDNPFILSMAFSAPAIMIQENAYVGGKRFNGSNGKFADFLMATASTGNLALIEIKRPQTDLLTKNAYRGTDVYGPSAELNGAIYQVLDQRFRLHKHLPVFKDETERNDIHAHAVRCIVIAGTSAQETQLKKSFEIVRNAFSDVTIITFDELCSRLIEIHNALSPPSKETVARPWRDDF